MELETAIVSCNRCPRLVEYRQQIAETKRRAYLDQAYWGKPVPSFGPVEARLLILGLAPGAHGANRTGRVFTGDSSGNLLYRVLYKAGFASQPTSTSADDGLRLINARISCPVRCAPPQNKPNPDEIANCRGWLEAELQLMKNLTVVVVLGKLAFDNYLRLAKDAGKLPRRRSFVFSHGGEYDMGRGQPILLAAYHPSQQNTFTGKLTEEMLLDVFARARALLTPGCQP
jgi:uracil-DNA glycosylase family 4